ALEDLFVPTENLVGGIEGQGLKQANQVFGYTRLMVATFGLGGGVASLERTIRYSKERVQFGTTLSEKQGYTHKLLVPNAVQLEAARAYIEETARRLDSGEEDLQVEGSIAKYFATEAGDAMANDGIQAFGGYGYIREYEVEKIKRDLKITTIFEGTSEIQRSIISTFRLRTTVRSKGRYYLDMAEALDELPEESGARLVSDCIRILNEAVLNARKAKLTKSQYVMFLLADMMAWCEVGMALCHKAATYKGKERTLEFIKASARLFAREVAEKVYLNGLRIACGCDKDMDEVKERLNSLDLMQAMKANLSDMDLVAKELVK
ncbi:MAG: acyl-CoA dehydrogenase, partial [Desulfobacteraceae bacterium]